MALRCPTVGCEATFAEGDVLGMLTHLNTEHQLAVPGVPAATVAGLPDYNVVNNPLMHAAQRRVYQDLARIREDYPQGCTALLEACTGFGKGCLVTVMAGAFKNRRMLFIVPGKGTRTEAVRKFTGDTAFVKKIGAIPANQEHLTPALYVLSDGSHLPTNTNQALEQLRKVGVVVCTAQLANNLLQRFLQISQLHQQQMGWPLFDLIVFDEGHHGPAATWLRIKDELAVQMWEENGVQRGPHVVYMTGTPYRLIQGNDYQVETERYTLRTAIAEEMAKDVVLLNVVAPPVRNVQERVLQMGRIVAHLLKNKRGLSGNAIAHKALVMVKGKGAAEQYAQWTNEAAIGLHDLPGGSRLHLRAEFIHGGETDAVRKEKMDRFEDTQVFNDTCIDVMFQHGVIGEGYDHPLISVACVMRKCTRVATLGQFLGRAVRKVDRHKVGDGVRVRPEDNVCHMVTFQCYDQVQLFADYVKQNPEAAVMDDEGTQGGAEEEDPAPLALQSPVEAEMFIRRYFFPVDNPAHMQGLREREDALHFTNLLNWQVETIPIVGDGVVQNGAPA